MKRRRGLGVWCGQFTDHSPIVDLLFRANPSLWRTMNNWKENLKDNLFIVLVGSIAISFPVGYLISQQQEQKRGQWAEILFRQAKNWLTERGSNTVGSVEQGLEYARSAAEAAADKGAEYGRRLNPFHRKQRHRFFGIL